MVNASAELTEETETKEQEVKCQNNLPCRKCSVTFQNVQDLSNHYFEKHIETGIQPQLKTVIEEVEENETKRCSLCGNLVDPSIFPIHIAEKHPSFLKF